MGPVGTFIDQNTIAVLVGLAVLGGVTTLLGALQATALVAMIWGGILMWKTGVGTTAAVEADETC